jgi:hypothetical protein
MSKQPNFGYTKEPDDTFQTVLDSAAKLLFWGGLLASLLSTGFLIYTFITFSGPTSASSVQAASNIAIFHKVLLVGLLSTGVGSAFMFWGEETLGAFLLLGAAIFFFAPIYVPMIAGGGAVNLPEVAESALNTIQGGGMAFGLLAVCILIADITMRVKLRSVQGTKADLLKYGKGVKEERDIQNVFMGKCWQLPYCRKFVRERCPIYHAKRTCWRERVGCMCEEEVIGNAMANKPIPKDSVAAASFIPVNNRLTMAAKIQRCKQCVIYNEHQKHKYRLAVPVILAFYALIVTVAFNPIMAGINELIIKGNKLVNVATYNVGTGKEVTSGTPMSFQIVLLACIVVVCLTYTLRLTEFLIFKAKV